MSQAASSEVMSIRAARCYEPETRAIMFANGSACTLDNMLATGLGKYAELVYEFCHNMAVMQTDHAEYALMTAISIFSGKSVAFSATFTLPVFAGKGRR